MKKLILIVFGLIMTFFSFGQYTGIVNGETGLQTRTKLNTMFEQLYNLNLTAQFSTDNASWHSEFDVSDTYVRLSSDLGVTWTDGFFIFDGVNLVDSLNMNNNRVTNMAVAMDANDAVTLQQMIDSVATAQGYDSLIYDDGFLKTWLLGSVSDSTLIDATNLTVLKDTGLTHLGTIAEHYAHISPPYLSIGGVITDNGDSTITVSRGEVSIKISNNIDAEFIAIVVPEETLSITPELNMILYVDYNAGSPTYAVRQSTAGYFYQNWDEMPFATLINIGSHIIVNDFKYTSTNGTYKNILSQLNYEPIRYLGGMTAAETGTRQLNVSAGALLCANDYCPVAAWNTSSGGTFTRMYYVTGSGWTRTTGQTTVSNSQYNNIATGLATLTSSPERWANKWLYYVKDDPDFWILIEGQTVYTSLAAAEAGGVPSTLPPEVNAFYAGAILVAKIIVSGNQTNIVEIQNPFTQTFTTVAASSHNNLSDLQYAAAGVSYGHINDQAQTIEGAKTFGASPLIPTATSNDSTLKAANTAFVLRELAEANVAYTDEQAQDAVGGILDDGTIGDIVFTYDDATPYISGIVEDDSHNHVISNVDNLQDSLTAKQNVITGAATTIDTENLTGNRALISNSSGKVEVSATISDTELGYLDGLTGSINTRFGNIENDTTDWNAVYDWMVADSAKLIHFADTILVIATKADLENFTTTETDPVYTASEAANITSTDITNLSNLSGTNTGDQNISGIAINADSITAHREDINQNITDIATLESGKQNNITLTTNGSSGVSTLVGSTLNIPNYTSSSTVSEKITVTQTTHGLAVDDWIRYNGTSYIKAQANTPENAEVIGVVDSVLDVNTFRYQFSGLYSKGTYTNGAAYFLSPDVAGAAITSPTYETGEVQVFLGTGTPAGFIIETDVGVQIEEIISVQALTTTGNSGAATLTGTTLNIPEYTIGGLGGIGGTGTTNYLPKFTGADTLGNSLIYDNGTNVGIGTTEPSYKLDVNGDINIASGSNYKINGTNLASSNLSNDALLVKSADNNVTIPTQTSNSGKFLSTNGTTVSWETVVAGGGNVSKVGTPVDNQVGIWTGDGTLEGSSALTFDGSVLKTTGGLYAGSGSVGTEKFKVYDSYTGYIARINNLTSTSHGLMLAAGSNTTSYPLEIWDYNYGNMLLRLNGLGTLITKKQRNTVLNGSQTGTFTHDSNNGDVGAYRVNAASTTLSIHNLASGDQGTIFLNFVTTTPTSLTVNTFSDAGSTGLTEVVIGSTPTLAINKSTSITYTCANDGTNTYVYLVYGQQP